LFSETEHLEVTVERGTAALARYVSEVRKLKGLTLKQLRQRGGPSVSWLSMLETGQMLDSPKLATLERLAVALDVPLPDLIRIVGYKVQTVESTSGQKHGNHDRAMVLRVVSRSEEAENHGSKPIIGETSVSTEGIGEPGGQLEPTELRLPVLGAAACGEPIFSLMEHATEYIEVTASDANGANAAFTIRGNSMTAEFLRDGDRVLVRMLNGARPETGKVVIVRTPDGLVAKRYKCDDLGEYLEEHEFGQEPKRVRFEEGSLVAVCVAHLRKM